MNALTEYQEHIADREVTAVVITRNVTFFEEETFGILPGYTQKEYLDFISKMNFEYDSGFGTQYVYGTIWYTDGTWSQRGEYDGSEWWEHMICPEIPKKIGD